MVWKGPAVLGLTCNCCREGGQAPWLWALRFWDFPRFLPLSGWEVEQVEFDFLLTPMCCLGSWQAKLKMIWDVRLDNPQKTDRGTSNVLLNTVNIVPLRTLDYQRRCCKKKILHVQFSIVFLCNFSFGVEDSPIFPRRRISKMSSGSFYHTM